MRPTTTVKDVMSQAVITISPEQTIDDADHEMLASRIRHLPVVDASGKLVGVISDRDIARAASKVGRRSVHIRSVMTDEVIATSETTPIAEAIEQMLERKIGCLPVVGRGGELVGIVTDTDCLRLALSWLREFRGSEPTWYRS